MRDRDHSFGQVINEQNWQITVTLDKSHGQVDGKHYTDYIDTFKELKRSGKLEEARKLLEKSIKAVERETAKFESNDWNWPLAPAYYWELAIVYRKLKLYSQECSILERYINHPSAVQVRIPGFSARLEKARKLQTKAATDSTDKKTRR